MSPLDMAATGAQRHREAQLDEQPCAVRVAVPRPPRMLEYFKITSKGAVVAVIDANDEAAVAEFFSEERE